jgi:hypothetical protein
VIPPCDKRQGVVFIGQPTISKGFDFFLLLCCATPSLNFYFYPHASLGSAFLAQIGDIPNLFMSTFNLDHHALVNALANHRIGIIPPRSLPMLSFDSRGRQRDISRYTSPLKFYDYCSSALRILAPLDLNSSFEYRNYQSVKLLESDDVITWSQTILHMHSQQSLVTPDPQFSQSGTWSSKARQYLLLISPSLRSLF